MAKSAGDCRNVVKEALHSLNAAWQDNGSLTTASYYKNETAGAEIHFIQVEVNPLAPYHNTND